MFGKVFAQIYDSTIAEDYHTRHMFMDLVVLADSDGVIDMPMEAISRRINVPLEIVQKEIAKLELPDPQSRTPDHEGRRIIKISGRAWGWQIVNYLKYRGIANEFERRENGRERVRRHRAGETNLQNGYVYYAMARKSQEMKIGFSQNPWARMKEFSAARPGLKIVATEKTTAATERVRHEQFEELRISGEWFKFEEPLISFVNSIGKDIVVATSQLRMQLRSNDSASASDIASSSDIAKEKPIVFPASLDTEAFHAAWQNWEQHRREIKKPLTPTSIKQQLKDLAEFGEQRAIGAILFTIRKGWQGLREDDSRPSNGNQPPVQRENIAVPIQRL